MSATSDIPPQDTEGLAATRGSASAQGSPGARTFLVMSCVGHAIHSSVVFDGADNVVIWLL